MELYLEVLRFYAHQMPLLEQRRIAEFVQTYTPDGVFEHASGLFKLQGQQQIQMGTLSSLENYGDSVFRHWVNHLHVEQVGDEVHAGFTAIVSVTAPNGQVTWEPSCTVNDILVRREGRLLVRSRVLQHDVSDMRRVWAGQLESA